MKRVKIGKKIRETDELAALFLSHRVFSIAILVRD
jgi:hypothetical protein